MALDKAIEHGKEHRKAYTGAKEIDPTCRNHGGCEWCEQNRTYSRTRNAGICDEKILDFAFGLDGKEEN